MPRAHAVPAIVLLALILICARPTRSDAAPQDLPPQPYPPAFEGQTRAPAPPQRSVYEVETLATGLVQPWALAFMPDGRMLVTERPGRVRVIELDGRLSEPIDGVPTVRDVRGRGMAGLALDPAFAENRLIYLSYYAPPDGAPGGSVSADDYNAWAALPEAERDANPFGFTRVARARLSEDERRLEDLEIILGAGGRRLRFAADGTLFVTTWVHPASQRRRRLATTIRSS